MSKFSMTMDMSEGAGNGGGAGTVNMAGRGGSKFGMSSKIHQGNETHAQHFGKRDSKIPFEKVVVVKNPTPQQSEQKAVRVFRNAMNGTPVTQISPEAENVAAKLMADALVNKRKKVDQFLSGHGYDADGKSNAQVLNYLQERINTDGDFRDSYTKFLYDLYDRQQKNFRNFIDSIFNAVGGIANMATGIVAATNKGVQATNQTLAQAALAEAEAKAAAEAEKTKRRKYVIIGVASVAGIITLGVTAYFIIRYRRNRRAAATAAPTT